MAMHTQAVRDTRFGTLEQHDIDAFTGILGEDASSGVVMDPDRLEQHNTWVDGWMDGCPF